MTTEAEKKLQFSDPLVVSNEEERKEVIALSNRVFRSSKKSGDMGT